MSDDIQKTAAALLRLDDLLSAGSLSLVQMTEEDDEVRSLRRAAQMLLDFRPIPVTERLPGEHYLGFSKRVLTFDGEEWRQACYGFHADRWFFRDGQSCEIDGVTHWLPMPPKPE